MLRRSLAAVVVMFIVGGVVMAATYQGVITKVTDSEVTIKVRKDPKDKKSELEEKKIKVNKDTKFLIGQGKDKEAKESSLGDTTKAVEAAAETKVKGVIGKVETEGEGDKEVATKITTGGGRKKKE